MLRKQVVGNWKMNGSSLHIREVLKGVASQSFAADISVCPPYPYLADALSCLVGSSIKVGAQDVSEFDEGAYTGEVSASMLSDLGCALSIVGHSERRRYFAETDATISAKLNKLIDAGLFGIYCVGETLEERDAGLADVRIEAQLRPLRNLLDRGVDAACFCVAYEPVWAIGTGRAASGDQIASMHEMIKRYLGLSFAVLYGGSVKASNAAELLALPGVDGVLVGGASLDAQEFSGICRAAG